MSHDHASAVPPKPTPLSDWHVRNGAKMADFAGWLMPIQYPTGIIAEHKHTREAAAIFDICHMGEFSVSGPGAAAALDRMLPRGVCSQKVGICRYNFLVNEQGGVIDDLLVYRMAEEEFFIVVNAGTADNDAKIIQSRLPGGVTFTDLRQQLGKLDLQGPRCFEVLADLGLATDKLPKYYSWGRFNLLGRELLISRTGYTGERGVELYIPRNEIPKYWDAIVAHPLVKPVGLGARDTLRLEMGYPLYGHEMDEATTPVEAGFGAMLDYKDRPTLAREALLKAPKKRLVGLKLEGRRAARNGMVLCDAAKKPCGIVTSGAFSPSLGFAIAMAFVEGSEAPAVGTPFLVGDPASAQLPATVVEMPFYKNATARK